MNVEIIVAIGVVVAIVGFVIVRKIRSNKNDNDGGPGAGGGGGGGGPIRPN